MTQALIVPLHYVMVGAPMFLQLGQVEILPRMLGPEPDARDGDPSVFNNQ
jgi:hypothetical protein